MRIEVARAAAAAIRRGHPWLYREGIIRPPRGLASGAVVELHEGDELLGRGLWDAESPIAARVHERERPLDVASITARVERALAARDELFGGDDETTAYRLVNGEGDRVPGLTMDRYGDVAVMRLDGAAIAAWLDRIAPPIAAALSRRGVTKLCVRDPEAAAGARKLRSLAGGAPPDRVVVRERGVAMEVDLAHGQKTGAFLDQRENRARVRGLAAGRDRVLNLYSYAGGFSIAAALGGAVRVTSVDSASAAHASAQRTFRLSAADPTAHTFVTADCMAFLEQAQARGDRFDLVISDPPSFAPSEKALPRALGAYRRLHRAIAAVLADGAIFCASSCSSHVTAEDFLGTLDDATLGSDRLRLREIFGQPADHPTLPAWPEGRYLKFAVLS